MNQNHLDTWFILYTAFYIFFSSWFDKHLKKVRRRIYAEKIY
jgi:hypothetical protein